MSRQVGSLIPCKSNRVIPRRIRSEHFRLAQNSLNSVHDEGGDYVPDLEVVCRHFENWLAKYHDSFVKLSRDDKVLFIRALNRFSVPYRRALRARMARMRDIDWSVKLEITLDPAAFMNLSNQFLYLPRLWNTISRWLSRTYGKFEFLRIIEITKKGRPHLHILLSFHDEKWQRYFRSMNRKDKTMRFQGFYEEFKAVSMRNHGGWVWVRPIKGSLQLVNYVMKYVNKSISVYSGASEDAIRYGALLFASNRRLFAVSKGLRVFSMPKKEKQGYVYEGTVNGSELKAFCQENDVAFGFMISCDPSAIDGYKFPALFPGYDREGAT